MPTRRTLLSASALVVAASAFGYGSSRFACRFVPRNVPAFFADADLDALRRFGQSVARKVPAYSQLASIEAGIYAKPQLVEAFASGCRKQSLKAWLRSVAQILPRETLPTSTVFWSVKQKC